MKYIVIMLSILLTTGCASTYNVNGVEPGPNQAIKVVGGVLLLGAISKGLAKNCPSKSIIRDNNGVMIGTIGNC